MNPGFAAPARGRDTFGDGAGCLSPAGCCGCSPPSACWRPCLPGATSALLVIRAERYLPGGFGLLLGAIGAGASLGPLLLARLTGNPHRPALVFGPYLLRGLVDLILTTTRSVPVAMAALGFYGVGTSTGMATCDSLPQAEVPGEKRGRVSAGYDVIWQAGRLIFLGLGGLAADLLGVCAVYLLGGTLLLVAGSIGFAGLRAVERFRPSP